MHSIPHPTHTHLKPAKNIDTNADIQRRAIQLARGKYLAIAESDDISHPQRLEMQAKFLRDNQNIGAVGAAIKKFSGQPPKLREMPNDALNDMPIAKSPKHCRSSVLRYSPIITHPVSMLRAAVLRSRQIRYNENCAVAFDVKLFIDIARVSDLAELNCTLLAYRIHPNNFGGLNKTRGRHRIGIKRCDGRKQCLFWV